MVVQQPPVDELIVRPVMLKVWRVERLERPAHPVCFPSFFWFVGVNLPLSGSYPTLLVINFDTLDTLKGPLTYVIEVVRLFQCNRDIFAV